MKIVSSDGGKCQEKWKKKHEIANVASYSFIHSLPLSKSRQSTQSLFLKKRVYTIQFIADLL